MNWFYAYGSIIASSAETWLPLAQYHSNWCHGFMRRQPISNHDIEYITWILPEEHFS